MVTVRGVHMYQLSWCLGLEGRNTKNLDMVFLILPLSALLSIEVYLVRPASPSLGSIPS